MKCPRRRRVPDVHVFRDAESCRWIVGGRRRTISTHRTQRVAIRAAIRVAKRRRVDVVTHGLHGRFRSKDSYGNESPVRDTEH